MQINHEHQPSTKSHRLNWTEERLAFKDEDLEMHLVEVGDTIVTRVAGRGGVDGMDMFAGLPNNMCQSEHMGVVLKGKVRIHTPDGHVDCEAGDAYFQAKPHRVEWLEDSVLVEFSGREGFWITQEAIEKNAK